jgi:transporter family-2 protein
VGLIIAVASVSVSLAAIGVEGLTAVAVPLLLVLVAGVLVTGQHLLNSRPTVLTGRAEPAALLTYLGGTIAMLLVTVLAWPVAAPETVEPWYFLCGFLGPVAILLAATLITSLGAFTLTLGIVTGQMSAALLLDFVWPSRLAVGISSIVAAVLMVGATVVAGRRP